MGYTVPVCPRFERVMMRADLRAILDGTYNGAARGKSKCANCGGTGKIIGYPQGYENPCPHCGGTGER